MTTRRLRIARGPTVKARPAAAPAADPVQAVIHVRLAPAASRQGFEEYLRTLPPVLCAWQVTGDVDYELLVACPAIADLGGVLACLRRCGGTEVTSAGLVLREVSGLGAAGLAGHPVAATGTGGSMPAVDGAVSLLARRQPGARRAATRTRDSGRSPRAAANGEVR